jgi:predicted dehydrogenase/NADPH:quinone reductase-like Zn-dependent oxidoreductase
MKQILQSLKSGQITVERIPSPAVKPGHLLIRTSVSLVSTGTERMLLDFGKANLINKARQQPDKVRMVLDKIKTEGIFPTLESVRNKLDQPLPLGYCNVGRVIAVGHGVDGFAIGDRVASNGKHSQIVCVPKNLCARVPEEVSDEAAAFTVIGAIALQGIRLLRPTLGETIAVTGLGLIGLMTVQLLRAQGCRVLGIDFDSKKCILAQQWGAKTIDLSKGADPVSAGLTFSRGRGVDGVIITASTKSNDPVHQAALMCRKRGRIVLVGVVGLQLSRADFYEKELSFQVSCSYGPGRYDPLYEEGGQDYPFGFVRWTEQRNFEAILDMLNEGRLTVDPLISHRFSFEKAGEAYQLVSAGTPMGIVLSYREQCQKEDSELRAGTVRFNGDRAGQGQARLPRIAFIGSGNYGTQVLIPAFKAAGAILKTVVSNSGVSGVHAAKKFGFEETTTDGDAVIADHSVTTLVIATRHDTHAKFICKGLEAGKHVFVEKPLCLTRQELDEIVKCYSELEKGTPMPLLMIGFNRRFSPQVAKMKELLESVSEPKSFVMTVNAGAIPPGHWIQDKAIGGGRIIGEACHFIDLLRFLAGSAIVSVQATAIGYAPGILIKDDKVSFTLSFADGSFGTVHYLSNGNKSFPKERLDVFCAGRILQLDNFRKLRGYGWPGFKKMNLWSQDKGQRRCVSTFIQAVMKGEPSPIPFNEIVEVTETSFHIMDLLQKR